MEVLPRGTIPGHTPVRLDLHLWGASHRVVKFVRPKAHHGGTAGRKLAPPGGLSLGTPRGRLAGGVGHGRRGPVAFWAIAAEENLLALSCADFTPYTVLAPLHLPRARGTNQLLRVVRQSEAAMGHRGATHLLLGARASKQPKGASRKCSAPRKPV